MIVRTNSRAFRVLCFLASPVPWLPRIVPLWIEACRVGQDYTSFAKVSLRYR